MARKPVDGLTDHELKIMHLLWQTAPLSVQEILDRFPQKPKPAYTSMLTAVQGLERKQFVEHEKKGKAFLYAPRVQLAAFRRQALKKFVQGVFHGDTFSLAANLVEKERFSAAEIDTLKKMLEDL